MTLDLSGLSSWWAGRPPADPKTYDDMAWKEADVAKQNLCDECGFPYMVCNAVTRGRMAAEQGMREDGMDALEARQTADNLFPPLKRGDPRMTDVAPLPVMHFDRALSEGERERFLAYTQSLLALAASEKIS